MKMVENQTRQRKKAKLQIRASNQLRSAKESGRARCNQAEKNAADRDRSLLVLYFPAETTKCGGMWCAMCVQSVMLVCIGREQSMFRVQPERKGVGREAAQKTKKAKTSCDTHRPSVRKQNAALWSFAQTSLGRLPACLGPDLPQCRPPCGPRFIRPPFPAQGLHYRGATAHS